MMKVLEMSLWYGIEPGVLMLNRDS